MTKEERLRVIRKRDQTRKRSIKMKEAWHRRNKPKGGDPTEVDDSEVTLETDDALDELPYLLVV